MLKNQVKLRLLCMHGFDLLIKFVVKDLQKLRLL